MSFVKLSLEITCGLKDTLLAAVTSNLIISSSVRGKKKEEEEEERGEKIVLQHLKAVPFLERRFF